MKPGLLSITMSGKAATKLPAAIALAAAVATSLIAGGAVASAADTCPNAAYRTGASAALPDCRAYELVSPAEKAGGNIAFPTGAQGVPSAGGMSAVAPDGKTAAFWSYQPFGDIKSGLLASYRATRTSDGWVTKAWSPAPPEMPIAPKLMEKPLVMDATDDLKTGFLESTLPFDPLIQRPFDPFRALNSFDVFKLGPDGVVQWQSRPNADVPATEALTAHYVGRSGDGSTVLFETAEKLTPAAGTQAGGQSLYVRSGGQTTLVAAPDGGPAVSDCGAVALNVGRNNTARRGSISQDGSRVFFTAPDPLGAGGSADPSCTVPTQVYVRDHGSIVQASASQRTVPDTVAPARFEDASADGSSVLFVTDAALTNDADPAKPAKLYRYDVGTGALTLLTPDGNVGPVIATSDDGKYVYYVAGTSVFLSENGETHLVADIPGYNAYNQIEIEFWLFGSPPVLATPDGRHLLFYTWAKLGSLDHPTASELYRFSADDDSVTCVSCNAAGRTPLGDARMSSDGDRGFWPVAGTLRNMSPDGSSIVFESQDALVPKDVNGNWDVYQWKDGTTKLISDGKQTQGSNFFNVDESGDEIFFATSSRLVGQDTDGGAQDIYVARVGGGFPEPVPPVEPCTSNCQGEGKVAPALPDVNTLGDRPSGPEEPERKVIKPTTFTLGSLTAAAKARFARTGSVTLKVKATAATKLTAVAQVGQGDKRVVVARSSRAVSKAGTVQVKLTLSRAVRRKLTATGPRAVVVKVSATGAKTSKSLRLRLNGAK